MSLKVSKGNGGDFELIPEGLYVGRCYRVLDLGTQETTYKGQVKFVPKIWVGWEVLDPSLRMKDGRPFSVSKNYTASLNEKSILYKDLVAWRGKKFTDKELEEFDVSKVLGAYGQVQVMHSEGETTYANVNTILPYKGEKFPAINEDLHFDIDNPDMEVFGKLSEYLQNKIKSAPEWNKKAESQDAPLSDDIIIKDLASQEVNLDEIPF